MKPPPCCSSLQDGGGFLCLGCACFCAWIWDAELDVLAGFGGSSGGGFTGQRRRGSAPSAALGRLEDGAPAPRVRYAPPRVPLSALRTEPPPRVPGMRLVQYQLLALSGCGRLARSVCFVSATVMKGLRLDNNKRIIFRTANNKDPSR